MALKKEYEEAYKIFVILGVSTLLLNVYYFGYPLFHRIGLSHKYVDVVFLTLREGGIFSNPYKTKLFALFMCAVTVLTKHGRGRESKPWQIAVSGILGAFFYFYPWKIPGLYIFATLTGCLLLVTAVALTVYLFSKHDEEVNDRKETFQQCEKKIENEYSINIPTKYQYKHKIRNGWLNIINPFAGTLITGVPGTGKTFSIFMPVIEQMIKKGFTMFLYDFKYPTLTYDVYNILRLNQHCYEKKGIKIPKFYVVNFNDPRYSHRCNPLSKTYLKSSNACTEIADVLMENLAATDKKDYFFQSGKLYINCCISFLWFYEGGRYCSFPHLIELMSQPAEKVTAILSGYNQIRTKVATFKEELAKNAQETIAGQVSSATVPLAGMATPELYWALSADDFTLDISNPDDPKIVCVGNDPDNKAAYSAALALFCARVFKILNHPGNLPSAIMLDEAPTLKPKDIDNVVSTARSNLVATFIGGQDESQFNRDYGKDNAQPIFNTVGNIISGRVNRDTAENYSKMFGKEFRERRSQTLSDDNESINISFSQEDILPRSTIETLSTGTFFGKTADDFNCKNDYKLFCGEVQVDLDALKERKKNSVDMPQFTSFDEEKIRRAYFVGDVDEYEVAALGLEPDPHKAVLADFGDYLCKKMGITEHRTRDELVEMAMRVDEESRDTFIEAYVASIIENHIQEVLEENMHRIQDDIDNILKAHGVFETEEEKNRKGTPDEEDIDEMIESKVSDMVSKAVEQILKDPNRLKTIMEESEAEAQRPDADIGPNENFDNEGEDTAEGPVPENTPDEGCGTGEEFEEHM